MSVAMGLDLTESCMDRYFNNIYYSSRQGNLMGEPPALWLIGRGINLWLGQRSDQYSWYPWLPYLALIYGIAWRIAWRLGKRYETILASSLSSGLCTSCTYCLHTHIQCVYCSSNQMRHCYWTYHVRKWNERTQSFRYHFIISTLLQSEYIWYCQRSISIPKVIVPSDGVHDISVMMSMLRTRKKDRYSQDFGPCLAEYLSDL